MKRAELFIHIPKTEWSSLARIFNANYMRWPRSRIFLVDFAIKEEPLKSYTET
jgi:hypothetical protein